jgi:hypothetical protein
MENVTQRILHGEKIYPYVNGKKFYITNKYEFDHSIKNDKKFMETLKDFFNINNIDFISDIDGNKIFTIEYKKKDLAYTLHLVQSFCELNSENFLTNYIDIFGNEIIFK